ncbi:TIGR02680 family protein [Nocardioides rubriscoriae]|uniref:TIGR02680 family protein n=1 Tax=Nocardioides rubriscoriae TaxID=642762 RepID=UPI0011E04CAD|nr:TIGR02680 family protein [Nocardioides rubriscoriae]
MTTTFVRSAVRETADTDRRFRLSRAGILNVWQYDDQVFDFADGRLLLRGANGAGKSKTLEMLLPFALDGDKARITASAKHHTSLLWLMTDGFEGNARVGYIWVEFLRTDDAGQPEAFTCGIGIRASESQRTATAWHFATHRRVGHDLALEDVGGPLSRGRLEDAIGADGQVFEKAAAFKEHVGRTLFGLDPSQYDEVLRLLYWLRQPQVGEDIDPGKLAQYLSQALPQIDELAIRKAGDTFDELVAFGEQIERRASAAEALSVLADAYADYARAAVAQRTAKLAEILTTERNLRRQLSKAEGTLQRVTTERKEAEDSLKQSTADAEAAGTRLRALQESPEARDQRRLSDLAERAEREAAESKRAGGRVQRRREEHGRKAEALAIAAQQLREMTRAFTDELADTVRRHQESVPDSVMVSPVSLVAIDLTNHADVAALGSGLDDARLTITKADGSVGVRAAAVTAVVEATARYKDARRIEEEAQRRADEAESRWEDARQRRSASEGAAIQSEIDFRASLINWAGLPEAVHVDMPTEFDAETLDAFPELVRTAVSGPLATLRAELQSESTKRDNADEQVRALEQKRSEVEAERDPAPPQPSLRRTPRPDGHSLWQVIDFTTGLDEPVRAAIEAALQSAGLLDAWLRPGGRLLDPGLHDTLLVGHTPASEPTLSDVLHVDLPAGSDVSVEDVRAVLDAVHLGDDPDAEAAIGADGTWRLGPAHGRAAKEAPQYIGATARAHERARRLAEIDQELQRQRDTRDIAKESAERAAGTIAALDSWVLDRPTDSGLREAWTRLTEQIEAELREELSNRNAQREAHGRRDETAQAHSSLTRLAQEHDLPVDSSSLAALKERLDHLRADLDALEKLIPHLRRNLDRWSSDAVSVDEALRELESEKEEHAAAVDRAGQTQAELDALREAVGASVQELERKIALARESKASHEAAKKTADTRVRELAEALGEARSGLTTAQERLASHAPARAEALAWFAQLAQAPGLLAAAEVASAEPFLQAENIVGDAPIPDSITQIVRELADPSTGDITRATDRVWAAHRDAESGPAADHQLAMARYGDLLAVTGRDDAGEAPVVVIAARVTAAVEHDRTLLTEREKKQFEQHILGELGDALRTCRRDADELVTAMNDLLGEVRTSQGIRLRLKWDLRDDIPAEARAAVDLLAQPVGALVPEERASLRDALHGLIETSRTLNPELSYSEHLGSALDYRTWSEFSIRYTRPEKSGTWERLHRRSALSQGEQKVLCYLPLFAAAAAHFTSLAGAAPHAPRLVLLDDAFPKIDVRTHPLLFGLLVQLDLDFVITSERLWGCHDTVPSLAIYEALRNPTQRGIAQYESRWDGRTLHSIG